VAYVTLRSDGGHERPARIVDVGGASGRRRVPADLLFRQVSIDGEANGNPGIGFGRLAGEVGRGVLRGDLNRRIGPHPGQPLDGALVLSVGLVPEGGADGDRVVLDRDRSNTLSEIEKAGEVGEAAPNGMRVVEPVVAHAA